jgi:hypothetical protein
LVGSLVTEEVKSGEGHRASFDCRKCSPFAARGRLRKSKEYEDAQNPHISVPRIVDVGNDHPVCNE